MTRGEAMYAPIPNAPELAENLRAVLIFPLGLGIGTAIHMPEDGVYEITKAFWDGVEEQREASPWLRDVGLEQAFTDLNMPLHPGALRYYEELGLDIPDELRPADRPAPQAAPAFERRTG